MLLDSRLGFVQAALEAKIDALQEGKIRIHWTAALFSFFFPFSLLSFSPFSVSSSVGLNNRTRNAVYFRVWILRVAPCFSEHHSPIPLTFFFSYFR